MVEGGGVQAGCLGEKAAGQKAASGIRVSKIFKIVLPPETKMQEGNVFTSICPWGAMYHPPPYCWQVGSTHPTAMLLCLN